MRNIKDCEACKSPFCLPECFNAHPGSMIALGKLIKESGEKVYIARSKPTL